MTELMIQENGFNIEEISAELGAASVSNGLGPSMPDLKMNYDGENGPMGALFLKMGKNGNCQDNVYAKGDVRFRAFSSHIQFQHWGEDRELINKSLLVNNKNDEARDQLGGVSCSLPEYEDFWALTEEGRKAHTGKDKYRVVRGLVSYTGNKPDGTEVTIENHPCVFQGKRKNYGRFYEDVTSKMAQGVNLWDFESILSKDTKTNAYKKKFYVLRFNPQFGEPIEMDQITYDSLTHVRNLITSENARINEAYKETHMQKEDEEEAARIMEAVDTFDADFV
jgi:hypothetical protein